MYQSQHNIDLDLAIVRYLPVDVDPQALLRDGCVHR